MKQILLSFFLLVFAFSFSGNAQNFNYALEFDGNNSYVKADSVSHAVSSSNELTMEVWIYPESVSGQRFILTFHQNDYGNRILFGVKDGKLHLSYNNGVDNSVSGSSTIPLHEWSHISVSIDFGSEIANVYLNGQFDFQYNVSVKPDADGRFSIGQDFDDARITDCFIGKMDEIRIWNAVRTQQQIQDNMSSDLVGTGSELVAWYKMSDGSGTSLTNDAGTSYAGTFMGGVSWTTNYPAPGTGDGSVGSPFEIATLEDLLWLSGTNNEWDKNYIQTANIDASSTTALFGGKGLSPIGNYDDKFTGSYDGQEYNIDQLYTSGTRFQGLFGYLDNASVKNLGLTNVDISGSEVYVGALAGRTYKSTIDNCHSTGSVRGQNNYIGGLVGENFESTISNCYSTCDVNGETASYVGGLVGHCSSSGITKVANSYILNCYSKGTVKGGTYSTGGLVGNAFLSIIQNSYSTSNVGGERHVGGLVGLCQSSTIQNSYSVGTASGTGYNTGGLVGQLHGYTTFGETYIDNCFSASLVTGSSWVGGLIGHDQFPDYSNVNNSFWDMETSGMENSAGGSGAIGKTTHEMKTLGTFTDAGWDFADGSGVWGITDPATCLVSYPYLQQNQQDPAPGLALPSLSDGGEIASDQTICFGGIPDELTNLTSPSGYDGTLEYKWQQSTTSATTGFSDIPGSNSENYSPAELTVNTWFKRLARVECVADWTGAVESNAIKITIDETPPAITVPDNIIAYSDADKCGTVVDYNKEVVDVSQTEHNLGTAGSDQWQSFKAGQTGKFTKLRLYHNGKTTLIFSLEVYEGDGISGEKIFTRNYDFGTIGSGPIEVVLPADDAPLLTEDNVYTFRIQGTGTGFLCNRPKNYPDGTYYSSSYGYPDWNLKFTTYLTTGIKGVDNCGQTTITQSEGLASGAVFPVGTTTNTFIVTDDTGNTAEGSFTVTVEDNVVPNVVTQNITVQLNASGAATIDVDDIDNGSSDNCGIATLALSQTDFDCSHVGSNSVTLTVTDVNGNTGTATSTVTVVDDIDPTAVAQNVTIYLDADGNASTSAASVNNGSSDNCGLANLALSQTDFDCSHVGSNSVTLTVTDVNGNTGTTTSTVTVVDDIDPTAVAQNVTIYLDAEGQASVAAEQVDNSSTDNIAIVSMTLSETNFTCEDLGENTVTLTVADAKGNSDEATATVTVVDNIPPEAQGRDLTVYLDENGVAGISPVDMYPGESVTFSAYMYPRNEMALSISSLPISPEELDGSYFKVNNSEVHQMFLDRTDSYWAYFYVDYNYYSSTPNTIELFGARPYEFYFFETAFDNCGETEITLSKSNFNCSEVGENEINVTTTDESGNSSEKKVVITVIDQVKPVAVTQDITVQLDATGNASITAAQVNNGSSDNCGIANLALSQTDFDCSHVGSNSVTLTVTDVNGNTGTTTSTVTVVDDIDPTAVAQNVTIYLDADGNASTSAASVNNGSSDNCGLANLALSQTDFDCSHVGSNSVTLTVTDVNGNTGTTTSTVTVVDDIDPTAVAQNVTIYLDADGNASTSAASVNNGSSDNCGLATLAISQTDFNCSHVGANTVTLIVTDNNDNVSTAEATVTVEDNVAPLVFTKNITVHLDASGNASIRPENIDNGSNDNCGIESLALSQTQFSCSDISDEGEMVFGCDNAGNYFSLDITTGNAAVISSEFMIDDCGMGEMLYDPETQKAWAQTRNGCGYGSLFDTETGNFINEPVNTSGGAGDFQGGAVVDGTWYVAQVTTGSLAILNPETGVISPVGSFVNARSMRGMAYDAENEIMFGVSGGNPELKSTGSSVSTFGTINLGTGEFTPVADIPFPLGALVMVDGNLYAGESGMGSNGGIFTIDKATGETELVGFTGLNTPVSGLIATKTDGKKVTLTVKDMNGNSSTGNAIVTVEDNIKPTVATKNITVQLDETGNGSITAAEVDNGSNDACGIASLELSQTDFDCSHVGSNTVILTVTDNNDNISTAEAMVTVEDNVAPVVEVQPLTIYLRENGEYVLNSRDIDKMATFISDACTPVESVEIEVFPRAFECVHTNTDVSVALTATDEYGNSATRNTTVTVLDTIAPVAVCKDIDVYLDENGTARIFPGHINDSHNNTNIPEWARTYNLLGGGSYDACGIMFAAISQSKFDCNDIGENIVTLFLDDPSKNQSSCTSVVTVHDTISPTVETISDIEVEVETGICETEIKYPEITATDNCNLTLVQTEGIGPDGLFPVGTTTEAWLATDDAGNSTTLSFNVIITSTNDLPSINPIPDVLVTEDTEVLTVDLHGISYGNDCEKQTVTLTTENTNPDLITSVDVNYPNTDTGSLILNIAPGKSGQSEITVTVTDSKGASVSETFTVVVEEVNHAPVLVNPVADQSVAASYGLKIPLSAVPGEYFDDPDGNPLTITAMFEGEEVLPAWVEFAGDTLYATPMIADTGCYAVVVEAFDGELTATDTFQVCVEGYPTSIDNIGAGKFEVNLYPNPTQGMVNVDIESSTARDIELTVLDITGKQVLHRQFNAAERITFDMSGNVSGMYLVKLNISGNQVIRKLILNAE
ncbi:Por secretion system C-terminal sorting domain-containing protein [Tangfeifania diversioriginum]|uniref:Por secretion system C-terminal sorting domain-containing protein n=1 Tax=Tangfeifania diversioriginum TaxID=1168035 RepID=A0A1M6J243_9BACT|nr:HYR domain-containing protein [Tangfeifania diversioriginum]SHJ40722.1 Por secretion system C-terminal sorting domain-containing protein [Tangfeifania diversioriginum]